MIPFLDLGAMNAEVSAELDAAYHRVRGASSFVGGAEVSAFEAAWADFCGADHAVGVANGTDALELALQALGVGSGDEVIVQSNTFVATVEAILRVGAVPRFVDVDPDTLLMTAELVSEALSVSTAAIVVVHLYGQMPDMDALMEVAEDASVPVVEDAAQAHGATWNGRPAGSFGHAACFSFYPGKNLGALGDGGAVVTPDADVATHIRSVADHGRDPISRHTHTFVGRNSRLDGLQAAFLLAKLPRLRQWNDGRRRAMERYRERLDGSPARMLTVAPSANSVHHLNVVQVPNRDEVVRHLAEHGVQTGIHYPVPCHAQPPYAKFDPGELPVVEAAAPRILSLPLSPHLPGDDVDRTCDLVLEAVGVHR
jgi:dTDP-4-amino-4,6-dideoxygalactose transaminase